MADSSKVEKVKAIRNLTNKTDANKSAFDTGRSAPFFQPKLIIGPTDDVYEIEADAVAEKVMRMPASGNKHLFFAPAPIVTTPIVQKKCHSCEAEEKLQRKEDEHGAENEPINNIAANSSEPKPEKSHSQDTLTHLIQRQEEAEPSTIPSPDPTGIPAANWFEMTRPFYNRGAEHLLQGASSYNAVLQPWLYNYNFFQNIGLGPVVSTEASNFFTPLAIDSALKADYPTWWETTDREMGASTIMVSPTLFNFDIHNIPGSFTMPAPFRNIFGLPENPYLQRKCKGYEWLESTELQRKEDSAEAADGAPAIVQQVLNSSGRPLEAETRGFMEERFGYNFSHVKIHTNTIAAKSAEAINALAYTSGNNVVFNSGQYAPCTDSGKKLLAHELTHVIQQKSIYNPEPVQRIPQEADPIHAPLVEQYRREHGLADTGEFAGPSEAEIKYSLAPEYFRNRTSIILNTYSYTHPLYAQVIGSISDNSPIWPLLTSRESKINFIRFLVHADQTNCRPYSTAQPVSSACSGIEHNQEVFSNLCMGFATQFYVRHTDAATRLSEAEISRLQSIGHIYAGSMAPKFRVPVFLAIYPGHAFNAFLVGDDAANIGSYLFLEPQNDNLFTSSDALFNSYFAQGIITINRLIGFNEQGQYQTSTEHTFALMNGAPVHATLASAEQMALTNLSAALQVAYDAATWHYTITVPQVTFESNFQRMATGYTDAVLANVFPYLRGRRFKRAPASPEETLTRDIFLQLISRSSLASVIPL